MNSILEWSEILFAGGPAKFFSALGTEKISRLWFARRHQYSGWHYDARIE